MTCSIPLPIRCSDGTFGATTPINSIRTTFCRWMYKIDIHLRSSHFRRDWEIASVSKHIHLHIIHLFFFLRKISTRLVWPFLCSPAILNALDQIDSVVDFASIQVQHRIDNEWCATAIRCYTKTNEHTHGERWTTQLVTAKKWTFIGIQLNDLGFIYHTLIVIAMLKLFNKNCHLIRQSIGTHWTTQLIYSDWIDFRFCFCFDVDARGWNNEAYTKSV